MREREEAVPPPVTRQKATTLERTPLDPDQVWPYLDISPSELARVCSVFRKQQTTISDLCVEFASNANSRAYQEYTDRWQNELAAPRDLGA